MNKTHLSRRQFVRGALLSAAVLPLGSFARAQSSTRAIPIALQLYSVRGDCGRDFDGALAEVAEMGYAGVEFAGYYGYADKPVELRKKLDDLNLRTAATHIGTNTLRGDALKRTIDFHQTIGCKFLIVPGDGDFTDPEKSRALAETFNQAAAILKPLNMACGYHNHTREFTKFEGRTYWDLFAERTTPDVVLQQDCGWTAAAGLDPVVLMQQNPGRMKSTHFKPTIVGNDPGKKPILGEDSVDWVSVLAACRTVGGTEWITIEQERYLEGKSPMQCSALSLAGLQRIL